MDPEMARNPQAIYPMMREVPVMAVDGMVGAAVLLSTKEVIDEALRHPEIYSSNMDAVDLRNKRPMIPAANRTRPIRRSTASCSTRCSPPRKMTAMEDEVAVLVNAPHRPLHRPGRG